MLIGLQPIQIAQDIQPLIAILMKIQPLKNTTMLLVAEELITSVKILLTEFGLFIILVVIPLLQLREYQKDGQTDPLMEKELIVIGLPQIQLVQDTVAVQMTADLLLKNNHLNTADLFGEVIEIMLGDNG